MRSSPPEAHAIARKVEPSSVRATTPTQEEAYPMAFERQSSHRRRKCVSVIAKDAVSPATLAAPFVFINMCLPASACFSSTPDTHELSLIRPPNVAISILSVPESPVNVVTSHLLSAIATHSIRRIPAQQVPHILCLQNIVVWLVELWNCWPYAHYTCITQLLLIGGALDNMNVDLLHVARARTLATLLESQATAQSVQLVTKPDAPVTSEDSVEDDIFELISWLTILGSEAGMIFCGQQNELAAIERMVPSAASPECEGTKSYHNASRLFTRSKA